MVRTQPSLHQIIFIKTVRMQPKDSNQQLREEKGIQFENHPESPKICTTTCSWYLISTGKQPYILNSKAKHRPENMIRWETEEQEEESSKPSPNFIIKTIRFSSSKSAIDEKPLKMRGEERGTQKDQSWKHCKPFKATNICTTNLFNRAGVGVWGLIGSGRPAGIYHGHQMSQKM